MTPFGYQLRLARMARRVDQRELAAQLGIRQGTLSDIELGNCQPPGEAFLDRVRAVLDLSPADLEVLRDSGRVSHRTIRLGAEFEPDQIQFVNLAYQAARNLRREDLAQITEFLRGNVRRRDSSLDVQTRESPERELHVPRKERSM